jgi:hypothetical protein
VETDPSLRVGPVRAASKELVGLCAGRLHNSLRWYKFFKQYKK